MGAEARRDRSSSRGGSLHHHGTSTQVANPQATLAPDGESRSMTPTMAFPAGSADPAMPRPFSFGENWQSFLRQADSEAFAAARSDIERWLGDGWLKGKRVLDIGSGSGIHSFCMLELGASAVVSIDIDPASVAATSSLHQRAGSPANWTVTHGSVLDAGFMAGLGTFDLVYAWGVLHHTGAMWQALERAAGCVGDGGLLWLALYTAGGGYARDLALKQRYNRSGRIGRRLMELREIVRLMRIRLNAHQNPFSWNTRGVRGMDPYHDIVDWLGGLPYEVASADELVRWARGRGFVLERIDPTHERCCSGYLLSLSGPAGSGGR